MSLRPVVRPVLAVLATLLLVAAFGAGAVSASVTLTTGYAYDGPPAACDGTASVHGRGAPELGVRQARADARGSSRGYDDRLNHWSPAAWVDAQGTPRTETSSSQALDSDGGIPAAAIAIDSATTTPARSLVTPRAADDPTGLADDYIDITAKGSRVRNVQTSVSRSSFEQNLIEAGYRPTVVSSGKNVVSYELNGVRYVVRDAATSTGGPTSDFYPAGSSSFTLKIRLRG